MGEPSDAQSQGDRQTTIPITNPVITAPPTGQISGLSPLDPKFRYSVIDVLRRGGSGGLDRFLPKTNNLDESFFNSFASYHLRTTNLPVVIDETGLSDSGNDDNDETSLPLFDGLNDLGGSDVLTEKSLEGPSGEILALRKMVEMNKSFALAEMRYELSLIREKGTTDSDQMARIRRMLVDFAILKDSSIKRALEHEERRLIELRCEEHVRLYPRFPNALAGQNTMLSLAEQTQVEAQAAEKERKHLNFREQLQALSKPGGFAKWAGMNTASVDSYLFEREHDRTIRRADFPKRFLICIGAVIGLIVPMVIMVLNPSVNKSLITSSIATILVAAVIAWNSSGKPHELLSATAAYTAVLVIFVGFHTS
ncbi:hypothetical protein EG329_000680 [Mollisiaceae sp. DMI_Dod_QoI]|nr:hypothetical protein EG329_000680 [Helotiales sp. DMI_Dod_QoI]